MTRNRVLAGFLAASAAGVLVLELARSSPGQAPGAQAGQVGRYRTTVGGPNNTYAILTDTVTGRTWVRSIPLPRINDWEVWGQPPSAGK